MLTIADCGLMLEPQLGMTMSQLVESAKLAEDLGFGYVYRSDHLLPTDNRRGIDSPECWTSLGAISAATSRIKYGPMVTPIGFRNPALLAKMACTLHSYSEGRLQLAVGAGWYEPEYKAHGYPFPDYDGRVGQFSEALDVMIAMIRIGRADFDGRYFSAHTDCLPRPHGEVNLIIGAKSPGLVKMAAQRADEWNIFVAPQDDYLKLKEAFDGALGGRKVEVSETGPFMVGKSDADLESSARQQAKKVGQEISPQDLLKRVKRRNSPCGTVDSFTEQLRAKVDGGVQKYYFQTLVPENTAMLELLADVLKSGV
ncbi:MAG TPA: LLM class flavin-dependent oxidoreductase [Nitrososphaerales archaeon]|nr:LLM class flavin-dependent oxidoreductase [Nitrososphaerales archaeon]